MRILQRNNIYVGAVYPAITSIKNPMYDGYTINDITAPAATLTAIAADYRFIPITYFPIVLSDYQQGLLTCLANWQNTWTVVTGAYTLSATLQAQSLFTSLLVLHQTAISAGQETVDSSTWFADNSGAIQSITVGGLISLLLAYGAAVVSLHSTYYSTALSIQSATTLAQLDAITIGS